MGYNNQENKKAVSNQDDLFKNKDNHLNSLVIPREKNYLYDYVISRPVFIISLARGFEI